MAIIAMVDPISNYSVILSPLFVIWLRRIGSSLIESDTMAWRTFMVYNRKAHYTVSSNSLNISLIAAFRQLLRFIPEIIQSSALALTFGVPAAPVRI